MPPRELLNLLSNLSPQERAVYQQLMESRARATALTPTANAAPTTLTTTGGGGGGAARLPSGGGGGQIIPANQTTATGGSPRARVRSGRPVVDARVTSRAGQAAKGFLRGLGKAAVPLQAAMNAKDIYDLASGYVTGDDSAQEEANRDYQAMGDDGVLMRMGKSAINPINTIAGMFGTLSQAVDDTGMDIDAEANRMALLPQNLKARDTGNARDEAMAEYFTPEERAMVEKIAVRDKGLLRAVGDVQTPEQAKELRDYFFGVPEPTAEDAVDQGLAPAFEDIRSLGNLEPSEEDDPYSQENIDAGSLVDPNYKDKKSARQASNEGMAGQLKAEAARQARVSEGGTGSEEPKEEPKEDYTQQAIDLFQTAHYTPFDPKSSTDKKKLAQMVEKLERDGGLGEKTANQFSLEYYREFGYV